MQASAGAVRTKVDMWIPWRLVTAFNSSCEGRQASRCNDQKIESVMTVVGYWARGGKQSISIQVGRFRSQMGRREGGWPIWGSIVQTRALR